MQTPHRQIRADFDDTSIVVYQAYRPDIALPALDAGKFVPPFSYGRMTWIKPSFLWMMERSGWATKVGQEQVLALRIRRECWEEALGQATLSHHVPGLHGSYESWRRELAEAPVRVQWDPERSLAGGKLEHRSIQVGLGRQVSRVYALEWITEIRDITPLARRIRGLREQGDSARARKLLPHERVYPTPRAIQERLGMDDPT